MTIYKRPDNTIFAESAQSGEVVAFENMPRGWGVTLDSTKGIPPMEWFNFLQNRTDKAIQYILQNGITEYDTNLEYPQNAVVKSGGKLYLCLRQNTNKPLSNGACWELLIKNATTSQKGVVQLSNAVDSTDETKASTPKATKTAYDKAVQADNNANSRVKIDGSTAMTGDLHIKSGDLGGVRIFNDKNGSFKVGVGDDLNVNNFGRLYFDEDDRRIATIGLPKKNGVVLLDSDKSNAVDLSSTNNIATSLAVKIVNDKVISNTKLINSKENKIVRSSSITSSSQTDVATSLAVKTVNDLKANITNPVFDGTDGIYHKSNSYYSTLTLDNSKVKVELRAYSDKGAYFCFNNDTNVNIPKKTGTLILDTDFTSKLNDNGWTKLPNGLIFQWGYGNSTGQITKINYNISFNRAFKVVICDKTSARTVESIAVWSVAKSYFEVFSQNKNGAGDLYWFAVGI